MGQISNEAIWYKNTGNTVLHITTQLQQNPTQNQFILRDYWHSKNYFICPGDTLFHKLIGLPVKQLVWGYQTGEKFKHSSVRIDRCIGFISNRTIVKSVSQGPTL